MTTINLYQDQQKKQQDFSFWKTNGGFLFSLGILFLVVLTFMGLNFYVSVLKKQNTEMSDKIQTEKKRLSDMGDLDKIIDMQTRLSKIKENLNIEDGKIMRLQMTDILDHLSKEMLAEAIVSSYIYNDNGTVTVTFQTNGFGNVARQVLSFKKSNYFINASLERISRNEKLVVCDVKMGIK
jgi:hypothetical protein